MKLGTSNRSQSPTAIYDGIDKLGTIGEKGDPGYSAYESYVLTTTDDPILSEAEWSKSAVVTDDAVNAQLEEFVAIDPISDSDYLVITGKKKALWSVVKSLLSAIFVSKESGKSLVADTEISKIHSLHDDDQDLSNLVVKETGKSLVADTEISKIHVQGTDQGLDTGGLNAVTAAQAKAGYTHSGIAHAPSNAVSLATVKADTDIASAISLKHASGSDNQVSSDFEIANLTDVGGLRSTWSAKLDHTAHDLLDHTGLTGVPSISGLLNETSHDLLDHTGLTGVPSIAGLLNETSHDLLDHTGLTGIHASGSDNETASTIASINHGAAEKSILVNADEITGQDSQNSFGLIRTTWTNVKTFLKTYFDGLYSPFAIHVDTYDPTGWLSDSIWNKATVAIASTTKLKLTISSTTNIKWYWRGVKTDYGATILEVTSTLDKSEGVWYCYSTNGTSFVLNKTPFYIFDKVSGNIRADLMIWEFYWDNTNDGALWLQPEFHACSWSRALHSEQHEALGTRYSTGLDITYGTLPATADVDKRIKLTYGEIHDEDISAYILHSATPTAIWEQSLGSTGTADANYAQLPIYYRSGADASLIWRKMTATSYPFSPITNNVAFNYNRLNAGTWDYTTATSNNNYWNAFVVATTNQTEPIVVIAGRIANGTLATVQAEALPNLATEGLFTEYKLLYRLIYRNATNTAGKATLISVTDYRKDSISNNASPTTNPNASLVTFAPSGNIASINVQTAIEELDSEKSGVTSGTSAPASTPIKVGDIYVDTNAKKLYFATGIVNSADWTVAN